MEVSSLIKFSAAKQLPIKREINVNNNTEYNWPTACRPYPCRQRLFRMQIFLFQLNCACFPCIPLNETSSKLPLDNPQMLAPSKK